MIFLYYFILYFILILFLGLLSSFFQLIPDELHLFLRFDLLLDKVLNYVEQNKLEHVLEKVCKDKKVTFYRLNGATDLKTGVQVYIFISFIFFLSASYIFI